MRTSAFIEIDLSEELFQFTQWPHALSALALGLPALGHLSVGCEISRDALACRWSMVIA